RRASGPFAVSAVKLPCHPKRAGLEPGQILWGASRDLPCAATTQQVLMAIDKPCRAGRPRLPARRFGGNDSMPSNRPSPALLAGLAWVVLAVPAAGAPEPVDYLRDIKPLLRARCYACHGALKQKAQLRLDSAALIRKGGRSGPAIVPGKSTESILLDAV